MLPAMAWTRRPRRRVERSFRGFRRFVRSAEITQVVDEGSRITAGGRELAVLRAPGHSPTDTLFFSEVDGVLLGGDHLLERISSNAIAHWPIDDREPEEASAAPDRRRALPIGVHRLGAAYA